VVPPKFAPPTEAQSIALAIDGGHVKAVQWLLHRQMDANQQMRWSPRGAHLMLKVRTPVVNRTFNKNLAAAERWARRPFHKAA
jgi:hypothetical protein